MTAPIISAIVPYHSPRDTNGMLDTAIWSLMEQTIADRIVIVPVHDEHGRGEAWTRNEGLRRVVNHGLNSPWTLWLDSDDWAYPDHAETLLNAAVNTGSDYTYSYFTVHDEWERCRPGEDPLMLFGKAFDPETPTQTTSTILVSTNLAYRIGYRDIDPVRMIPGTGLRYGTDFDFTVRCARAGARITHVPRRTWAWRIGSHNTSGIPGHGDAKTLERTV